MGWFELSGCFDLAQTFLQRLENFPVLVVGTNLYIFQAGDIFRLFRAVVAFAFVCRQALRRQLARDGFTHQTIRYEVRCAIAFALLRDSTTSISEVAVQAGFRNPALFTAFSAVGCDCWR